MHRYYFDTQFSAIFIFLIFLTLLHACCHCLSSAYRTIFIGCCTFVIWPHGGATFMRCLGCYVQSLPYTACLPAHLLHVLPNTTRKQPSLNRAGSFHVSCFFFSFLFFFHFVVNMFCFVDLSYSEMISSLP